MGGAVVASIGDPTTVYSNPAALSFLQGTNFSFGATVMIPEQRFFGVLPSLVETKMQAQVLFPPNVSLNYTTAEGLGFGVSLHIPFAAKTEWNQDWVGRLLATKSEFRVAVITPSFSMRFGDRLSGGIGLNVSVSRLLYERRFSIPPPNSGEASTTLDADGVVDYGIQAGLLYKLNDSWSFGASYCSRMNLDFDRGRVRYRDVPPGSASDYGEAQFSATALTPDIIQAGFAWHLFSWLEAVADIQYMFWSEFKSFDITYFTPASSTQSIVQNWRDVLNGRFGLEFTLSDISIRGGMRIEQSPIPDPALVPGLPDADANAYAVGIGYKIGEDLVLDFAYELLQFKDRTVTNSQQVYDTNGSVFNGTYTSRTSSVSINVRYTWK